MHAMLMMKTNNLPMQVGKKATGKSSSSTTTTTSRKVSVYLDDHHSDLRIAISQVFTNIGLLTSSSNNNNIKSLSSATVIKLLEFILYRGVIDNNNDVRTMMLQAGSSIVSSYGEILCKEIMMLMEKVLALKYNGDNNDEDALAAFDYRHTATVLFLGKAYDNIV